MNTKHSILITAILLLLATFIYASTSQRSLPEQEVVSPLPTAMPEQSPEVVPDQGFAVPTSSPLTRPNMPTPSAATQTKNPTHPLIILDSPQQNQLVSSPLKISGQARGNWYFEGSFPVILTDWNGLIIAEGVATAQGNWMTQEFVPFSSTLTFTSNSPVSNRGSLILQKSNPSGLPANDDAYEITIFFE